MTMPATLEIPKVPADPPAPPAPPVNWAGVASMGLGMLGQLAERTSEPGKGPRAWSPVVAAVVAGVVAGLVSSAALWGLHEVLGGAAVRERFDRQDARIEKLEDQQVWIRWSLESIAQAVDARIPPSPKDTE